MRDCACFSVSSAASATRDAWKGDSLSKSPLFVFSEEYGACVLCGEFVAHAGGAA